MSPKDSAEVTRLYLLLSPKDRRALLAMARFWVWRPRLAVAALAICAGTLLGLLPSATLIIGVALAASCAYPRLVTRFFWI